MGRRLARKILTLLLSVLILCSCSGEVTKSGADTSYESTSDTEAETTTQKENDFITSLDGNTEEKYNFTTDPSLYKPVSEREYGLTKNSAERPSAFELSGTLRSATGTSLNLIVEWSATRKDGESVVTFKADVAVDHKYIVCQNFIGHLYINEEEFVFMSPYYEYTHREPMKDWLCPVTVEIPCGYLEDTDVSVKVVWEFVGRYENTEINGININGTVSVGEKYAALKRSVNYNTEIILQNPDLPEGCEVTSLAMLLRYLGFDAEHTFLADNYLEQGEVGKVSYYEYNLGNPRKAGESWGCYSPVIVKTANKYLCDEESYYRAYDLTGYDANRIYYELSMGHPAIVWITMNFAEPYTKNPWTVDGKKLYWKYPLHCVLLTGYDLDARTVTIADPQKKNPVTVSMDTFELRFMQMEAQAVVIKESEPK